MLGTEGGELLIIEGSELKATMSTETGTGVCSLLSHSKVRDGLKVWGVLVLQDPHSARMVHWGLCVSCVSRLSWAVQLQLCNESITRRAGYCSGSSSEAQACLRQASPLLW